MRFRYHYAALSNALQFRAPEIVCLRLTDMGLKFPSTAQRRGERGFHRLLRAVDVYAPPGLQFTGTTVAPGAAFDVTDLPRPAVLLENAGSARVSGVRSRYSFENLWVLWDFCFEREEWREIVRTTSPDASWSVDFAPIAHRLLHPGGEVQAEHRARPVAEQLAALIDERLSAVSREVACYALAGVEQHIAAEIVRRVDNLSVIRPAALRPRVSAA